MQIRDLQRVPYSESRDGTATGRKPSSGALRLSVLQCIFNSQYYVNKLQYSTPVCGTGGDRTGEGHTSHGVTVTVTCIVLPWLYALAPPRPSKSEHPAVKSHRQSRECPSQHPSRRSHRPMSHDNKR